ncbi:NAD(P)H-dependent glycerol-3-phosphate dehydrogenase [Spiroplasma endosymbiont of Aspidapion aeneum]|uniref:NAD(P)H-dependent glycerol-3-phosphate dehydrogenase n=1 Tax=Spiroplasma endosymbiont of Aspidapion aeneum TaxID=3066276 RepID=UPI00313D963B
MKSKVAIIGTGAYGTVLANVIAENHNQVTMYGIDRKQVEDIDKNNLNKEFFGDILINKNINATCDIKEALNDANVVIICVPTFAIEKILELLDKNIDHPVHIINTAKGLVGDNHNFLSKKIKNYFRDSKNIISYGGIYGPSLAKECIMKKPTCVMMANEKIEIANELAKLFINDHFYVQTTTDILGCEIAGALKNTIAIACGIIDGFGYGDNAHACLITIGHQEICRFAKHFGAKEETFLNFATMGDLVLTASSKGSRNFSLGNSIAFNDSAQKVLESHKVTVEGVLTCKLAVEIAKINNISMPLFELMYEILYNKHKPSLGVKKIFPNSMAKY